MKRFLTSLLACLLVLSLLPVSAAQEPGEKPVMIYAYDTYEGQEEGAMPHGVFFWGGDGETKYNPIAAVTGEGNDSSKCVLVHSNPNYTYGWLWKPFTYAPIDDHMVFSLKVMTPDIASKKVVKLLANAMSSTSMAQCDQVGFEFNLMEINDQIKVMDKTLVESVELSQWYDLTFYVNVENKTMDVYLNGKRALSGLSLRADLINLCGIEFLRPDVLTDSEWYFDDVFLYRHNEVLSKEELAADWAEYEASEIVPESRFEIGLLFRYDNFVFRTMYNRFIACIGGVRYYKNNQYYDLPVPITEAGQTYMVPIRAIADSFGATTTYDNGELTVTNGSETLKCTVGSDIFYINDRISKTSQPVTLKDGHACITMEVLQIFFDFDCVRDGDLLLLDGKPLGFEYDYGVIGTNEYNLTFEEEIFKQIKLSMLYSMPTPEEVLEIYKAHNPTNLHPRMIVEADTFDMLKREMQTDAELADKIQRVLNSADGHYEKPVVEYHPPSGAESPYHQQLYDRALAFGFAYKITGDVKYKDKLWENIEAASKFPDFSPWMNALHVGNSGSGISIAYDWLYDEWTEEQRQIMEKMMLEMVLEPMFQGYEGSRRDYLLSDKFTSYGNQNVIINHGGIGCALSLIDKYPETASLYLSLALKALAYPFSTYAPEGAYVEGTSYWNYIMMTLPYVVENLQVGLGNDFGLSASPGLDKTAFYPLNMQGTEGTFNFGDATVGGGYDSAMQWFAKEYNNESLAILRANNPSGLDIKDVLYHMPNVDKNGEVTMQKDTYYPGVEQVMMRSGWNDGDIALALHGGNNSDSHGHIDNGAFILDAFGERWACEVPKEDYNLTQYGAYIVPPEGLPFNEKWYNKYYRSGAEGHNTIVVGLDDSPYHQEKTAQSNFVRYESQETGAYAILDMTETSKKIECGLRGIKLDRMKQEVVLQDNFRANEETDFWWFMHTQADVELTNNNKTAILSKNGKKMWVSIISDGDEVFQHLPAEPLPNSSHPPIQTPNDGYTKLGIHKENTDEFKVTVAFKQLLVGQEEPSVLPVDSPMETWKFPKDRGELPTLAELSADGEPFEGFQPGVYNYAVKLLTEKTPIPVITAKAQDGYTAEVVPAESIPGITSVILKDAEGNEAGVYNVTFTAINNTANFLNDKQIPIADYYATSEPESANGVDNMFDTYLDNRYATDERGGNVTLDFGNAVEVAEVKMAFAFGNERKEFFTIEVSTDGAQWQEVYSGNGNGTSTDYQSFTFEPVSARYLRVKFYGNSNGNNFVSVAELCAFSK